MSILSLLCSARIFTLLTRSTANTAPYFFLKSKKCLSATRGCIISNDLMWNTHRTLYINTRSTTINNHLQLLQVSIIQTSVYMLSQQFAARAVELNHEPAKAQPRWHPLDMKWNTYLIATYCWNKHSKHSSHNTERQHPSFPFFLALSNSHVFSDHAMARITHFQYNIRELWWSPWKAC